MHVCKWIIVLTTHRLAYLCFQCDASLGMKLALVGSSKEMSGELTKSAKRLAHNSEQLVFFTIQIISGT